MRKSRHVLVLLGAADGNHDLAETFVCLTHGVSQQQRKSLMLKTLTLSSFSTSPDEATTRTNSRRVSANRTCCTGLQILRWHRQPVKLDQFAPREALSETSAHGVSLSVMDDRRQSSLNCLNAEC